MSIISKQKGYYAPDLSGCFVPFIVLCILGVLGLYQAGSWLWYLWGSVNFNF